VATQDVAVGAQRPVQRTCEPGWGLALGLGAALLCLGGCQGLTGEPSGGDSEQGADAGGPGSDDRPRVDGGTPPRDNAGYQDGGLGQLDVPAPATRFARLTHAQWDNTVRDLFRLDGSVSFSDNFRSDPVSAGFRFDNNGGALSVDDALWNGYRQAAAALADHVTSDPTRLARIVPPDTGDAAARLDGFVRDFGLRVHRRPLQQADVAAYKAIHAAGSSLYEGMAGFEAGVRLLIETWLQSPHFLYRVEQSSTVVGGVIPLDAYEVAARLSYMLWNSMPDDLLFSAAASGELAQAAHAADQARRLLDDPRAVPVVRSFHHQLFEAEYFVDIAPAPAFFPDVSPLLGQFATTEFDLFLDDEIFARDGGYAALLTSPRSFVNDELAGIYGLSGSFDASFVPVTLDPSQRRGVFTQVGFLASNASSAAPDPIHRGIFLARDIACISIAAPPNNTPLPAPTTTGTNRQLIEDATEVDGTPCQACHKPLINPFGFPYESYDAIGAHRTTDNGLPVDTGAAPFIDGAPTPVDDALQLADALAASPGVHECYARHWLEFGYGRPSAAEDDGLVARLGAASAGGSLSIKQLIVALVETEAFLTRSHEGVP
jgi:hypothetical protein